MCLSYHPSAPLTEEEVLARARVAVAAALGGAKGKRGPGRPPKLATLAKLSAAGLTDGRKRRDQYEAAHDQQRDGPGTRYA